MLLYAFINVGKSSARCCYVAMQYADTQETSCLSNHLIWNFRLDLCSEIAYCSACVYPVVVLLLNKRQKLVRLFTDYKC